jgi:predicted AlkP superfamily pyrophosphatase or phosphodiesterase
MFRRFFLAIVAALIVGIGTSAFEAPFDPILVLVSFDGWRWDYTDRLQAPNLRALAARGVRVRELIPSFPVLTFPNHYTIVTGLYPEHHGIVGNRMLDPETGERFTTSDSAAVRASRWWGGEPLWVTAARQGRRTAAMFWPGTEAEIKGVRPTYWRPFDGKLPAADRVAQVLEWLALPEAERPSVITMYQDTVDHAGHDFGPDSPETASAVADLDRTLGTLIAGVERQGVADRTTIVVVSDHGMTNVSENRVIWLDDYLDTSAVDVIESDATLHLRPRPDTPARAAEVYRRLAGAHPRMHVFTRESIPARFHHQASARIPPIVAIPDTGWAITTRQRRSDRAKDGLAPARGSHGYDPSEPQMHALFVAAGPRVRRGLNIAPMANVHVYNFLCAVLNLTPAPNDGDLSMVRRFLR